MSDINTFFIKMFAYVIDNNEIVPTYLSAFIDVHSRYVVEGRYYFRQNLDVLIDSLGVPRQINNIATACLINAASKNSQTVNELLVNEAMTEFKLI